MKNYLSRRREGNDGIMDVWNDPFEDFFKPFFYGGVSAADMRTDIKETENGYEMQVDLPGFDKKDIEVSLKNGYLTVNAKKQEKEEDKHKYVRRERNYSCSRSYYVGEGIKEEDVKARYDNGILSLTVPKDTKEIPSGRISIE